MADVRLESGRAWISYELLEAAVAGDFSRTQWQIFIALLRHTDGGRRPTERLSEASLARYAGIIAEPVDHRPSGSFRQALRDLVEAGVILEPERGVFAIERNSTRWRELPSSGGEESLPLPPSREPSAYRMKRIG